MMEVVVVVLGVLLAATLAYVLVLTSQVRSVTRQLRRRLESGSHSALGIELVNRRLEALVARINEALRQSGTLTARARRDERRFRALIADISHDLRTPLTAVRGYQQLLERSGLDQTQQGHLAVVRRHTDELLALVERLHEYTYLLEAEPSLETEEVDVAQLVRECVLASSMEVDGAGLGMDVRVPDRVVITTDREKLTRIVQNLLGNAIKHGQGAIRVELEAGHSPAVVVTNGIPPGAEVDVERIFDRFHTGDVARSQRTGGLGLSIVKVLAAQLGGHASACVHDNALSLKVTLQP